MSKQTTSWCPVKIPIRRMEDEFTFFMGRTKSDVQFWAYNTFVFLTPEGQESKVYTEHRNEYVVLHTFDAGGTYLSTRHWMGGSTENFDEEQMLSKINMWLEQLGDLEFSDIEIKPFSTEIDSIVFGLIPEMETKTIVLEPSTTITFMEPWDGEYYT